MPTIIFVKHIVTQPPLLPHSHFYSLTNFVYKQACGNVRYVVPWLKHNVTVMPQ